MARKKSSSKKSRSDVVVVDFGEMQESEGGGKRYKEGDYLGTIINATRDVSSDKGSPCIKLTLRFDEGRYKGKKVIERLWLSPKALPRLADLMEILGIDVGKKEVSIPLKKLKGKQIGFSLEDEEYEGKMRSRVSWDFLNPEDVVDDDDDDDDEDDDDDLDPDDEDFEDDDDDDEEEDDEDDDDDEEEYDLDEMDRAELKQVIKDEDLDIKVTKKMKDSKLRKLIAAELEDEDDDDDELEELDLDEL